MRKQILLALGLALGFGGALPEAGLCQAEGEALSQPRLQPSTSGATLSRDVALPERTVELDEVGCGEMLVRRDGSYLPLAVVETEVVLEVTGPLIHGTLAQVFQNPYPDVIEAIYVFPLPEKAAVHAMEMRIGERIIVSEIQEKKQAQRTYQQAKEQGKKAALLEQERPNLFTSSVANINPGESIEVRLEFYETSAYIDSRFSLAFPLTFTPRYIPDVVGIQIDETGFARPVSSTVPEAGRVTPPFVRPTDPGAPRARISVSIHPGVPLATIESTSHAIQKHKNGEAWEITLLGGEVIADRDFHLAWYPAPETAPQAALFTEEFEGDSYALMMLLPPVPSAPTPGNAMAAPAVADPDFPAGVGRIPGLTTETLFIIDVSGSMDGPSIRQARTALDSMLDRLRPGDRFNLLKFNNTSEVFAAGFQEADSRTVAEARRWVDRLQARGGTEIYGALSRGLDQFGGPEGAGVRRIVFLTDGAVGNEAQVLDLIRSRIGDIRIHSCGIGYAPNRYLMKKMAWWGHGYCEFISTTEGVDNQIAEFFRRIDRPVMSDLAVHFRGVEVGGAYPSRLPDLHAGEPLFLAVKIRGTGLKGKAILTGRDPEGEIATGLDLSPNAPARSGIVARWARLKVSDLMDLLHEGAKPEEIQKQVTRVGLDYHLVTPYTSLVAVDHTPTALAQGSTVPVANGLPHGSKLLGPLPAGGTDGPFLRFLGLVLVILGLGGSLFLGAWNRA